VKLYVCYGTFTVAPRPGGHPCGNAYKALREEGWDPDVIRTYGLGLLPDFMNPTRRPVRDLTGQNWVPVLQTDEGEVVQGSKRIIDWARQNPATESDGTSRT
jgi:hypothetical protein